MLRAAAMTEASRRAALGEAQAPPALARAGAVEEARAAA